MKYNNIIMLILMFALLILPMVNAEGNRLLTQNKMSTLSNDCNDNGYYCNPSTNCYISIINPNGTTIVSNYTMQIYNYPYWSINLSQDNNSILGEYKADMTCINPSGRNGTETFYYKVTPTGYDIDTSKVLVVLIGFFGILLLAGVFFIFGTIFKQIGVKIFLFSMSVLFVAFGVGYGYTLTQTLIGEFTNSTGILSSVYILITILLGGGGIGLMLWLIYYAFNAWRRHRGMID